MKKLLLGMFLIFNILSYADTSVRWNVEESYNSGRIIVTCSLRGDIYHTFRVEVEPFGTGILSDGQAYDYSNDIKMKVEKQFSPNKKVADYKCTLEKDYKTLVTFYFRAKNVIVIESM